MENYIVLLTIVKEILASASAWWIIGAILCWKLPENISGIISAIKTK